MHWKMVPTGGKWYQPEEISLHCVPELRKERPPSKDGSYSELRKKVQQVYKSFDPRAIQKGFMRSYSRNELGDLDETLIPSAFKDWYLEIESDVSDFETYVEDDEVHTVESDSDETTS